MMEYRIVTGSPIWRLAESVNIALEQGWKPVGGVVIESGIMDNQIYRQAVVRNTCAECGNDLVCKMEQKESALSTKSIEKAIARHIIYSFTREMNSLTSDVIPYSGLSANEKLFISSSELLEDMISWAQRILKNP